MNYFVSVRPRRLIQYNLEKLQVNAPTDCVLGKLPSLELSPFALTFTALKFLMETKVKHRQNRRKNDHLSVLDNYQCKNCYSRCIDCWYAE